VLRDDFDPARSDVDVLAEFAQGALDGIGFRYFGYGDELSSILGQKVDFLFAPQQIHRGRRAARGDCDL